MIKVEGLYKRFNSREILKNINIELETGKVNTIIGKSGSGKTVLLKSLIGLIKVDNGKILYGDRDLTLMDIKQLKSLRQEIGVLFQGGALFDSLSVINNVKFPLDMFSNMSEKEKEERATFCLRRVNLEANSDSLYPSEISGGMQKRVAIARAIVLQPKFLFCDEPNSGLDPVTSVVIDNLIMDITKDYSITTIVNTHDMNSVFNIGEKIIFIENGVKEWEGDKNHIYDTENNKLKKFLFSSELIKKIKDVR